MDCPHVGVAKARRIDLHDESREDLEIGPVLFWRSRFPMLAGDETGDQRNVEITRQKVAEVGDTLILLF